MPKEAAKPMDLLTVRDAAKVIGVGWEKIHHWISTGELLAINLTATLGNRPSWRIRRADLEAFVESRLTTSAAKQVNQE